MSVINVWKHKRRICNLILGLKGLMKAWLRQRKSPGELLVMPAVCVSNRSVWEKASPPSDCSAGGSSESESSPLRRLDVHGSQDTLYHSCWSLSDFPGNEKGDDGNEDAKSLNESLLPSNSGAGLFDLGLKWSSYGNGIHGNPVWANIPNVRALK